MKTIFKWLGWLLMSPFRIVWRLITAPWRQDGRRGIYLGPISIWLFIICLMTVLATIVVGLFWGLRYLAGNASLADWPFIAIAIGTLTAMGIVYVWKSEKRVVGTSLMIGLTLFGARVRIYLLEGNYNIDLENFLIGSTSKVVKPGTNEQGEFYADIIDFELWGTKDRDPNGKPLHPVIETNSRKGSGVKLRITLKIWLEDPQQWLSPRDAAQLIGDSGRKAGRAAATEVTSFDITDVPKLIGELMRGHTIISARLAHTVGQHRDGCLIYTKGGERIYMTIVTPKDDVSYETEVTAAKAAFLQKLRDMKDQIEDEVWTECSEKNIPRIEEISIESTILATLKEAGAVLQEVLVSDVDLNETEQKAVNKVAAEAQEAVSEARTAKSAAAAATALQTAGGLTPREATMLGAATAGTPVTTINIPGLETLAQAFIAVLGNRKKDNDQ